MALSTKLNGFTMKHILLNNSAFLLTRIYSIFSNKSSIRFSYNKLDGIDDGCGCGGGGGCVAVSTTAGDIDKDDRDEYSAAVVVAAVAVGMFE